MRLVDKSALSQWAADEATRWCVANVDTLLSKSEDGGFQSGRFAWKRTRDLRAWAGTQIHETIEAEHTGSWNFPALDDEQQEIMAQWRALNERHKIAPILSEFTVWNPGIAAGTADAILDIDGVRCLVDYKTSKNMWPEHNYQLAALAKSPIYMQEYELDKWREEPMPAFDKVAIIHLRSDKAEIHYIENIEENYSVFESYVNVWNAKEKLKAKEKINAIAAYGGFA